MLKKMTTTAVAIGLVFTGGTISASNNNSVYAQNNIPALTTALSPTPLIPRLEGKQSIMGVSLAKEEQMLAFARSVNPAFPAELPKLYIEIGNTYGIRGDIAFCQMLKETGYHRFGGIVQANQHNYAGIGAVGNSKTIKGNYFKTPEQGVRAHIQHLYAYASKTGLPKDETLIDARFKYVARGIAPSWQDLNGRWAVPGKGYGEDILKIYAKILSTPSISE
ncbi:glucosaminidase domain-containing protein [Aneurinibacillus tyrosinisolvens]|uniref:glucosaminidase domain-containing protein n=1 Tax=Aneurinibacillus tyrosinisolvens TaxID=1443435 RepID=UPI00069B327F|nr:glucosaminidase domain-containing protein [Aneurinibacillus tyrosinisolvens]